MLVSFVVVHMCVWLRYGVVRRVLMRFVVMRHGVLCCVMHYTLCAVMQCLGAFAIMLCDVVWCIVVCLWLSLGNALRHGVCARIV